MMTRDLLNHFIFTAKLAAYTPGATPMRSGVRSLERLIVAAWVTHLRWPSKVRNPSAQIRQRQTPSTRSRLSLRRMGRRKADSRAWMARAGANAGKPVRG